MYHPHESNAMQVTTSVKKTENILNNNIIPQDEWLLITKYKSNSLKNSKKYTKCFKLW